MKVGDLVKYKPEMKSGTPTIVGIVLATIDSRYVNVCFTWHGESVQTTVQITLGPAGAPAHCR